MAYSYILTAAAIPTLCFVCKVLYRLFLHPLAGIPGPWLPAITSFYSTYYDCSHCGGGQYPPKLKELHERYGPIILPVPGEVHISDPDCLDTIYAIRDRNSYSAGGLMVEQSVGSTEDHALHRLRREALNPYFSARAVVDLEPLLTAKAAKLAQVFEAYASFGLDNGLLDDISEAHRQREALASLLAGVPLQNHFRTSMRFVGGLMTLLQGQSALPPGLIEMIRFRARIRHDIDAVLDDKANHDKGSGRSLFYELRDSTLPQHEKTADRLQDEATLLVMAGTESPAKTLTIASFYLLSQPLVMRKLRQELTNAREHAPDVEIPLHSLTALSYLGAVIHEANRLSFGVTNRMRRYSPTETLAYTASYGPNEGTTYALPPGTKMSTVTYCTHLNETLFPDPWHFDPGRWLGNSEEVTRRKRCLMAFGKGHRRCLGIYLANAEMSLALAALAQYDMKLFETDESDVTFKYDNQISHPKRDSKGVRAIVRGNHI
ncbi:hypothetical protein LTR56_025215 [Elasticomyces elasticus]|nr:hypothetical protein LTR56_025215 [Elasticomyces elasticus]KAK4899864.1 hypothetical protein LTR49_027569 [Elasticomyces elasticus]